MDDSIQPTISLILGAFIISVIGLLIFNYFNKSEANEVTRSKTYTICYEAEGEQRCKDTKDYDIWENGCVDFQQMDDGANYTLCGSYQIIGDADE